MAKTIKETVSNLNPAPYNPLKITDKQLAMLKKSMTEFGDLSGIVVNVRTGNLVGGHQRIKNLDPSWPIVKQHQTDKTGTVALGYIETPSGRWQYREVDWPEKKEAAANIAANQHGGEFDMPALKEIILTLDDGSMDMELIGFNSHELELMMTAEFQGEGKDETYTSKIISPVYEPKGERPPISALIDRQKTEELLTGIEAADLPDEIAQFLRFAAERHTVFNFRQIAEYYCHADITVQDLMERSALIIIDFKKAIENGFVHLTERLGALADQEEADGDA